MSPTEQISLQLDSKFGKFVLVKKPVPSPGVGQLLVKIEASGLNPVDWKIQKYGIYVDNYPIILGSDIAGVVEEVGESVVGFAKGDRVAFQTEWGDNYNSASYQQYALAKAETTAKIPDNISYDEAASIPVAIAAAAVGLYAASPKGIGLTPPFEPSSSGRQRYDGQPLVVLGGASSVGQVALQLGKLSGFSPIITTASLKHASLLKDLGATHIIDRHAPLNQLAAEVAKITSVPIRVLFDAISSSETNQAGYDLLVTGGKMASVLTTDLNTVPDKENVRVFGVFTLPETKPLGISVYSNLTELLANGHIKPNRVEVVPGGLAGVVDGLAKMEQNLVSGQKLVVHPQETVLSP